MDSTDTPTAPAPTATTTELAAIRALLRQRKFTEGLSAAQSVLAGAPEQRDALLAAAIAQRFLGRVP